MDVPGKPYHPGALYTQLPVLRRKLATNPVAIRSGLSTESRVFQADSTRKRVPCLASSALSYLQPIIGVTLDLAKVSSVDSMGLQVLNDR